MIDYKHDALYEDDSYYMYSLNDAGSEGNSMFWAVLGVVSVVLFQMARQKLLFWIG